MHRHGEDSPGDERSFRRRQRRVRKAFARRYARLPGVDASALKRFNMALRWLVRRDGIVDMGIWQARHQPSSSYRSMYIRPRPLSARSPDAQGQRPSRRRKLTANLRLMRPDDPSVYDFALFGIGEAKMDVGAEI